MPAFPDILLENDDFIALNKPAGLLSIPDRAGDEISLKIMLKEKYGEIFTVHRIDRNTSGIIVFAKNETAHKFLSQAFEDRTVEKYYAGIIQGTPSEKEKTISESLMLHPGKNIMVINKKGKSSVTDYQLVQSFGKFSLARFRIHTGRTHQIRVHMQFLGHPIVCDELYGDPSPIFISSLKKNYKLSKAEFDERPMLSRLGLHAQQLIFKNSDGVTIDIEAPLPKDMRALLQQLNKWKKRGSV